MIKCYINKEELYPVYFLNMSNQEFGDMEVMLTKNQVDYIQQVRKDFDKVQELLSLGVDRMKEMERRKKGTSQSDK